MQLSTIACVCAFLAVLLLLASSAVAQESSLDELFEKYKSNNRDERVEAVLQIGKKITDTRDEVNLTRSYELLISAAADKSDLVRSAARMKLVELGSDVNAYLKPFVESDSFDKFAAGCETVKAIGPPAKRWIPTIAKKIDSEESKYQFAALHTLSVMNGDDLVPYFDQTVKALDAKNFNNQVAACKVLRQIGPKAKSAGPRLVKLLKEGIVSSRSWATIALGAIGPHEEYDVVKLLSDRLEEFYLADRERALVGLAYLGPVAKEALPRVEKLMNNPDKSVQHVAARTWWKITGETEKPIKILTKLLPTLEYGTNSMDILGELGVAAKSAVPALMEQLKSNEEPHRESAVFALAAIGPDAQAALDDLKKMSKSDPDRMVREGADFAIRAIKKENLKDKNPQAIEEGKGEDKFNL